MQRTIRLDDLLAGIVARKAILNLDIPSFDDALRNPGDLRTPQKCEMLRLIDERALAAEFKLLPGRY